MNEKRNEGMDAMDENCVLPKVPSLVKNGDDNAILLDYLQLCTDVTPPADITVKELMDNSRQFPRKFPIETMRCSTLMTQTHVKKDLMEKNANSAYPLLHETALFLYIRFLEHKKKHGIGPEKTLYASMGLLEFVQRLLEKRSVTFFAKNDKYLLLSGEQGISGWEAVGSEHETTPLFLSNCLSYDEMKLSALLSVSSWSYFINEGTRDNKGVPQKNTQSFTTRGIIIGLIGARLKRIELMEWQEVLITKTQNTKVKGYGAAPASGSTQLTSERERSLSWRQLWADFYGIKPHLLLFEDIVKLRKSGNKAALTRYRELNRDRLFDNVAYKKRMVVSIETLLFEAEARAVAQGTTAYIHVVGIGLGVWRASEHQEKEFLDAFASCLRRLRPVLQHVSDINFAWFKEQMNAETWKGITESNETGSGIRIMFSKRPPHSKLSDPEDADKLLVVSYAWDGNALPGNEFWLGKLGSTGDSAAASSTQITELHNPHINKNKVSGANLHIASEKWGILHISEYVRRKMDPSQTSTKK
ncbi:uncharacterized protein [Periplaneta americana]|uniref:uncharacterized protein isoform X1 n=1 Tax=Periplaneta americana TaxID=6978 RepID=UPI0037E8E088